MIFKSFLEEVFLYLGLLLGNYLLIFFFLIVFKIVLIIVCNKVLLLLWVFNLNL